jgi:hypothetical protein
MLRMSENRELWRAEYQRSGENYMMNFMVCPLHQILIGWSNQGDGRSMWYI